MPPLLRPKTAALCLLLSLATLLSLSALPGCTATEDDDGDDDAGDGTGDAGDAVLETSGDASVDEADAAPCACAGGSCPEGQCDVRVVIDEDCRAFLEVATVLIDGEVVGEATIEAPYVSCRTWACDEVLAIEVRSTAISTGVRNLAVSLDPDVPLSCDGL